MKAAELRQAILQAAVQGKLVTQDPNDEPASELLERIRVEKARLAKEGKIKKEKNLPPITETQMPFALPPNWLWCRVKDVALFITSGSRDWAKYYSNHGAIFLRMGNLSKYSFNLRLDSIQYVLPPTNGEGTRTKLEVGDLLVSITGDVGSLGLIPEKFGDAYINQHTALIRFSSLIQNTFFPYILLSPFCKEQFNRPQRGIKNSFRLTDLSDMFIPLPPLTEQTRIVKKIELLMGLCDVLEANEKELDKLENHFAEYLPKSILQMAVQGKLVAQNPDDEPASKLLERINAEKAQFIKEGKIKKEKPLLPIGEDEIPYELPKGWSWVRMSTVFNVVMGQSPPGSSVTENKEGWEFHQGKSFFTDKYLSKSLQCTNRPTKIIEPHTILLSVRAPVGAVNITDRGICIGRGLCAIKPFIVIQPEFIYYFVKTFETDFINKATGTTFIAIAAEIIKNQLFPLPPLAEQQRIVAKIEELMQLCDSLKMAHTAPIKANVDDSNILQFPQSKVNNEDELTLIAARGKLNNPSQKLQDAITNFFND